MYLFPLLMSQLFQDTQNTKNDKSYQVIELDDKFQIKIPALGREMSDLNVEINEDIIEITAQAPQLNLPKNHKILWQEFVINDVSYHFRLPNNVKRENVNATLQAGILTIDLVKEQPQRHTVKIDIA